MPHIEPRPTIDHDGSSTVFTVDELCADNKISRVLFYSLRKAGKGPRVMKLGRRTLITKAAVADWHTAMETEAQEAAK